MSAFQLAVATDRGSRTWDASIGNMSLAALFSLPVLVGYTALALADLSVQFVYDDLAKLGVIAGG